MDFYIKLAEEAVKEYVLSGKTIHLPANFPPDMFKRRAGVFVSIHKKDGSLRGCIGTFLPVRANIAQEIIANAIAAATQDPRFPPITEKELDDLEISVDILSKPKKLDARRYPLDPKHYGLIVSATGGRRGLLLPDIPGVETAAQQIEICRQKAGINPDEPVQMEVFTVERHEEN